MNLESETSTKWPYLQIEATMIKLIKSHQTVPAGADSENSNLLRNGFETLAVWRSEMCHQGKYGGAAWEGGGGVINYLH